ncbi:MAG: hypothetical protein L6Q99_02590 [Planctomycetes bacterium]|nr:hypothetical protein [Planctomycetota bacterium]
MLAASNPWVLLYVAAMFAFAGAILWRVRVVQQRTAAAWQRFASERGLRFVRPQTAWWQGSRFHIEGEVRGVDFRIEKHVVRRGKNTQLYTLLTARGVERTSSELKVVPNDLGAKITGFFGVKGTPLGDAEFDQRFVVRGGGAERPSDVLHEALRAKLGEFEPFTELVLHHDRLTLRWLKLEPNPEKLQRAIELAVLAFLPPRAP